MRHDLTAVFNNRGDAQHVLDELILSGFAKSHELTHAVNVLCHRFAHFVQRRDVVIHVDFEQVPLAIYDSPGHAIQHAPPVLIRMPRDRLSE